MISNTSDVPMLAGGFITMKSVTSETNEAARHTKIICTLGPACWEVEQIEKLIDAGMTVARFNFSDGDLEEHTACLERLQKAAENKSQNIAVMLDTKGPEIRTGYFANGAKTISVEKGESIILTTDYSFKGDEKKFACSYPSLPTAVSVGQRILIAGGSLLLTVASIDVAANEVTCMVGNNAVIGEGKKMNLPGLKLNLPTLTDKDKDDIQNFAVKHKVDFIAASDVRKSSDIHAVKKILGQRGQNIKIIAKIENLEGIQNFLTILRASDGIMLDRGDLGMDIPPEKVFLAQKYMIREANIHGKPIITASQMLESMINNPRPTRAECSDVANAVIDGTDCVLLSEETATGSYFEEAVQILARTCAEAENSINYKDMHESVRNSTLSRFGSMCSSESIGSSAVNTANDVNAKVIIVTSETGSTARQIAKFKPSMPICVLTPRASVARQCFGILKGVYAFVVDSLDSTGKLVQETMDEVVKAKVAKEGDKVVVVCGKSFGMGLTNQISVEIIKMGYWDMPEDSHSSARDIGRELPEKKGCIIS